MRPVLAFAIWLAASAHVGARPQASSSAAATQTITSGSTTNSASGSTSFNLANATTITDFTVAAPTGSYLSYNSQITLTGTTSHTGGNSTKVSNATTTALNTLLTGTNRATTLSTNGSRTTTTSSAALPSNTQKCNGYVEFCNRQYMNVTEVCAHNAAFSIKNNVASNQQYDITAQLDDGVRMIQGETHWYNNSMYACHTSCDLLNAGTLQNQLATVAGWVAQHPYDIVTILLVNSDYRNVTDYVDPIQNSGLAPYLYEPSKIPMRRTDWPTYAEMIITGKRVVIFMDYNADQTAVPYVLDEFTQIWETTFSPTNASFPCNQQRPPNLSNEDANNLPYLANHNLNLQITFASVNLLVPAYTNLSQENGVSGYGSAGQMMDNCLSMWTRPPSWLLVDYYNYGEWAGSGRSANNSGSVFEVAAKMNGVNYTRACCGPTDGNAATSTRPMGVLVAAIAASLGLLMVV